jgi:hypothetical protein
MITPPLPITDGDDPSTYVASTINHYQQYERKKFGSCSINTDNSYVLREQVIAALNNSSTILLPFTVDPHGGIGPLASHFLFGTTPDPDPDPAPAPAPAPLTFQRRNKHTTILYQPHRLLPFNYMLINLGIKILHIYHLEQHIILGFPALGHDKSLVQTSTLLFRNIYTIASTDQNRPSHALPLMHILLPLDVIRDLIFNPPLNNDMIVHK